MEDFGADTLYTKPGEMRDQLDMGYPNLKWVIPGTWMMVRAIRMV